MKTYKSSLPYKKWHAQKRRAKNRGIDFVISFEEWWDVWQKSGKWDQRGRGAGCYVMCRVNDQGPYAIGNVYIDTQENNLYKNGNARCKEQSAEWVEKRVSKMRLKMKGRKISQEHILAMAAGKKKAALAKNSVVTK